MTSSGNLNNLMASFNTIAGSSVYDFLESETDDTWNVMNDSIFKWMQQNMKNEGLRVLISLADGTVSFDSSKYSPSVKENLNTFYNFKLKKINENHNSRLAILTAMLGNSALGLENKYSTTTKKFTLYIAQRVGMNTENALGCIRISIHK